MDIQAVYVKLMRHYGYWSGVDAVSERGPIKETAQRYAKDITDIMDYLKDQEHLANADFEIVRETEELYIARALNPKATEFLVSLGREDPADDVAEVPEERIGEFTQELINKGFSVHESY